MDREAPKNILDKFATEFCKVVEQHTDYIIVSGFLVIATGRTRGTEDIDMIIPKLSLEQFSSLHLDLINNEFICMQSDSHKEIYSYLADKTSVRYTWKNKPLPEMEIKFAKDELDNLQIKTRKKIPLTGLDVWFSSISINIAFKEELLKSDKDMADARHLRIVFKGEIDEREINEFKKLIRRYRLC